HTQISHNGIYPSPTSSPNLTYLRTHPQPKPSSWPASQPAAESQATHAQAPSLQSPPASLSELWYTLPSPPSPRNSVQAIANEQSTVSAVSDNEIANPTAWKWLYWPR
ncbi:MAG: hypothetical protein Q9215_007956, partial [Flavoplaca cf. flavocitrina]